MPLSSAEASYFFVRAGNWGEVKSKRAELRKVYRQRRFSTNISASRSELILGISPYTISFRHFSRNNNDNSYGNETFKGIIAHSLFNHNVNRNKTKCCVNLILLSTMLRLKNNKTLYDFYKYRKRVPCPIPVRSLSSPNEMCCSSGTSVFAVSKRLGLPNNGESARHLPMSLCQPFFRVMSPGYCWESS